jgi:uncharacterized protein (DUF2062 family)
VSTATPTATRTATQASLPTRAAVRWYQLAVIVLGLALAAATALAIYFAVNHSIATSGIVHSGPVTEQPCWQSQVAC